MSIVLNVVLENVIYDFVRVNTIHGLENVGLKEMIKAAHNS
jgi:hypothetical protein